MSSATYTSLPPIKCPRRRDAILQALDDALMQQSYSQVTIEEIASRAGVGKSTIYRWWKDKSELVLELFKARTEMVFEFDYSRSLSDNLIQQLIKLAAALNNHVGRAVLVAMAENRNNSAVFFRQYLRPRREQTLALIRHAIRQQEIDAQYDFELMLDSLYAPIHYHIVFFNMEPNRDYIEALVKQILAPIQRSSV